MFTLRPAVLLDAADIVRINVHCWQQAYTGIIPQDILDAMDVAERTPRYRRYMAGHRAHETLLATDPAGTAGYVHFGPYRDGDHLDRATGEVVAIYVDPPRWGTGAGRFLMQAALDRLAGRGWAEVRLWVLEANHPARGFYARLGFAPDGARASYPVRRTDGTVEELAEIRYTREDG